MAKKHKVRIDTSGSSGAFGNNAFQNLSLGGLPDKHERAHDVRAPETKKKKTTRQSSRKIRLEIRREKSGRAGKTVTAVSGVPGNQRVDLLKKLKKRLATGGTIAKDVIEIQGDFADKVTQLLQELGYQAIRSGG